MSADEGPLVAPAPDLDEQIDAKTLGGQLRRHREAAGLSMRDLSARSGVSQPFISQVEAGQFAPSMQTLQRLAEALAVPPARLLVANESHAHTVRAGNGTPVAPDGGGEAPTQLLSRPGSALQAIRVFVDHSADDAWFEHPGEDFVYVLDGTVDLEVVPDPPQRLYPGDSVQFSGASRHALRVVGDPAAVAEVLVVINHRHEGLRTHRSRPQ